MKNLVKILHCFHALSGLRINISKNKLYGIGVELDEIQTWASNLGCGCGSLRLMYLGLPVGASMKSIENWKGVMEKLSSWKEKMMSFGGRLTLVKTVLGNLILYYFFIFRAPREVIRKFERIGNCFF